MIYGYARVSTKKQQIDYQVAEIARANSSITPNHIYKEVYSSATMDRPQWKKLKKLLQPEDTVYFYSVSRLGRNATETWEEYLSLVSKNIHLIFLQEPYCNSDLFIANQQDKVPLTGSEVDILLAAVNQYLRTVNEQVVKRAFEQAEKELHDIRQRTKDALAERKAQGIHVGCPKGTKKKESPKITNLKNLIEKYHGTLSYKEISDLAHVDKNTYYKYLKEYLATHINSQDTTPKEDS